MFCCRFHPPGIKPRLTVSKANSSSSAMTFSAKYDWGRLINVIWCELCRLLLRCIIGRRLMALMDGKCHVRRQTFLLKSVRRSSSGCNMSSVASFDPWGSTSPASLPEAGRHSCEPPGPSCQQMVRSQAPRLPRARTASNLQTGELHSFMCYF